MPAPPRAPSATVLLVDDDAETRDYMRACLTRLSLRIVEAADGLEAMDLLRDGTCDDIALVVSDLVMPRMDGLELEAALHADARWADVPMLLVTGQPVYDWAGPMLSKPFNAKRLLASVRTLLPAACPPLPPTSPHR
ncbi:MAG: response regulator [Bacteroidota bacterium]